MAPDPNPANSESLRDLAQLLSAAERLVVLTGAGISVESGIPPFRGPEGLWRTFRPEQLATPQAFQQDPHLVWEWYDWRRGKIASTRPNPGHEALVRLEDRVPEFTLLTQNVDGLHRLAGSKRLLEIHGNIWEVRCLECGRAASPKTAGSPCRSCRTVSSAAGSCAPTWSGSGSL